MADTLEQRIGNAIDQHRIVDDLGDKFKNDPGGEFLLAPANNDLRFGILIYNIDILPDKAVFSAGMAFRDPKSYQLVAFRADNITFSYTSGITGPVALYLLDSVKISLGKVVDISLLPGAGNNTYASFDCFGLREFGIKGKAQFHQDYLVPVDDTGAIIQNRSLYTEFELQATSWSDLITEISIPDFQIIGLNGFVFEAKSVVLDLSETDNFTGTKLPVVYSQNQLLSGAEGLWEGFYIREAKVRVPRHFKSDKEALYFGVQHCFIDEFGFTGNAFAKNVLSFEKGSIAAWSISIKQLELNLELNAIKVARVCGDIGLPAMADTARMFYAARIGTNDNYLFTIATKGKYAFPCLKASEVVLEKNSYIAAEIKNGKIILNAELHGKFTAKDSNYGKEKLRFRFPEITFQGLHLSNTEPRFSIAQIGVARTLDSAKFAAFPVQFQSLHWSSKESAHILDVGLLVNVTEYAPGSANVQLHCKMQRENGRDRIRFERITVSAMSLSFEKGGVLISGKVQLFQQDVMYGSGFNGALKFALKEPAISAAASGVFGCVQGVRYWYFDADVQWPGPGVPLFPGMNLQGLSGGAWHRLKPWDGKSKLLHPEYGSTASGAVYVPDVQGSFGFKAGLVVQGGSSKTYQAKVILEMQFSPKGSLNQTILYGDLEVMPSKNAVGSSATKIVSSLPSSGDAWQNYMKSYSPKSAFGGPFMARWDLKKHLFTANAALFVKGIGGNGIQGANGNYKAGEMQMMFSESKWFVHLGNSKIPLAVRMKLGHENQANAKVYFMAGTELMPAPLPPAEISAYLGSNIRTDALRDVQSMASGSGFAFGLAATALAQAGGSDKKVSLYASMHALVAMDANLRNNGSEVVCSTSGLSPGVNGWYARGNAYAFLQGKVGAKAGNFKLDVMTFTGAMAWKAEGPNPFYGSGSMRMEFNLGGIVKYNGEMQVTLGSSCNPSEVQKLDSQILVRMAPDNLEKDVSTVPIISADFAVPVNRQFPLQNLDPAMFRINKFEVAKQGKPILGKLVFSSDFTQLQFQPDQPLEGFAQYTVLLEIGLWNATKNKPMSGSNGSQIMEKHVFYFSTGKALEVIPWSNVDFSYPAPNQVNFYSGQSKYGRIKLKVAQDNILQTKETKIIARFTEKSSAVVDVPITYNNGEMQFGLPSLKKNTVYKLRILRFDALDKLGYTVSNGQGTNPNASNTMSDLAIKTPTKFPATMLLEMIFRTSCYATFEEKIADMQWVKTRVLENGNLQMEFVNKLGEYFSADEIHGAHRSISVVADNKNSTWCRQECEGKIYAAFPGILKATVLQRELSSSGIPPWNAIQIRQNNIEKVALKAEHANSGRPFTFQCQSWICEYEIPLAAAKDLDKIKQALLRRISVATVAEATAISKYIQTFGQGTAPSNSGAEMAGKSASTGNSAPLNGKTSTNSVRISEASILAIKVKNPDPNMPCPLKFTYMQSGIPNPVVFIKKRETTP